MDDLLSEFLTETVESISVLDVELVKFEHNPATLDPLWLDVSTGVYRLDGQLLVVLDVAQLLNASSAEAA